MLLSLKKTKKASKNLKDPKKPSQPWAFASLSVYIQPFQWVTINFCRPKAFTPTGPDLMLHRQIWHTACNQKVIQHKFMVWNRHQNMK